MSNKNADKLVLELFNKVKEKQKEISKVEKSRWQTSCTIGYNPENVNDRVNIQTVNDTSKLVDIFCFLLQKEDYWKKANNLLGLEIVPKWMGYDISLWQQDIKTRINQININTKKKELEVLESRLDKLISQEQRREMELAAIAEELK